MTTTTSTSIADTLTPGFERTLGLAHMLLGGIEPANFARCPDGMPTMNHAAFIVGHCAIYPDRVLQLVGHADLAEPREAYNALFSPQARCQADPQGTIYPPMEELVGYFASRHEALKQVLGSVSDDVLTSQMPDEGFRARFPTIGSGVAFLVGPHLMMHLGQLSAWRRAMHLPPAMPHIGD